MSLRNILSTGLFGLSCCHDSNNSTHSNHVLSARNLCSTPQYHRNLPPLKGLIIYLALFFHAHKNATPPASPQNCSPSPALRDSPSPTVGLSLDAIQPISSISFDGVFPTRVNSFFHSSLFISFWLSCVDTYALERWNVGTMKILGLSPITGGG